MTNESLDFYIGQADEKKPTDDAGLRINNHTGGGTVHTNGIAVTSDGSSTPSGQPTAASSTRLPSPSSSP